MKGVALQEVTNVYSVSEKSKLHCRKRMLASPPECNSKPGAQQAAAYHCGTTGQLSLSKKELLSSQLNSCCTQGLQRPSSLIVVYRKSNTKA